MNDHSPEHSLALLHAPGMTPGIATNLLKQFGDPKRVCLAARDGADGMPRNPDTIRFLKTPCGKAYEDDMRWLAHPDHHLISMTADEYPARLKEDKTAPIALFVDGDPDLLNDPQIAIVGTREPTPAGAEIAAEFAAALARKGLIITSGLAAGIDAHAHRAALRLKAPTIAAVGTGLNLCYPARNKDLARQIADGGALISEFSCNTPARRQHFPQRNRIISGVSLGVIVIEASYKSGALITARLAGEQGRDVFAVPGSIRNPMAAGCHRLIQQGAKLVGSADEVFAEIAARISFDHTPELALESTTNTAVATDASPTKLGESYRHLLEQMGYDPVMPDTLIERCDLPAAEIASMLLVLELDGYVSSQNGVYTRVR